MRTDSDGQQAELPGPFIGLPRLLRDDALGHIKRELRGCATLESGHALGASASKLQGCHRLQVAGATHLILQMDARSHLSGSGQLLCETSRIRTRAPEPTQA